MPTFSTPEVIEVFLDIEAGVVRLLASERDNTVVRIASDSPDAQLPESVRTEFANDRLTLRVPKTATADGQLTVTVEVPAGSALESTTVNAELIAEGALGECRLRTSSGRFKLQRTGSLTANLAGGSLAVGEVDGSVEVKSSSGEVRVGAVAGDAEFKSDTGDIRVDQAASHLRMVTTDGSIDVGRARGSVIAKASRGSIRVGGLTTGEADLMTAEGAVEIGIDEGVVAWVDAHTHEGTVRNELETRDEPEGTARAVKVRARTRSGDISIHRTR